MVLLVRIGTDDGEALGVAMVLFQSARGFVLLLSVIISLFGIVNTLGLSIYERVRELGLLRAVGMSRRQVKRMIRVEAVIIAVLGAVLGLAIGIAELSSSADTALSSQICARSVESPSLMSIIALAVPRSFAPALSCGTGE